MQPEFEYVTKHYPGYGTEPCWTLKVVYNNRILDEDEFRSEYDLGAGVERAKRKWDQAWSKKKLAALCRGKKKMWQTCDVCGELCRDSVSSCCDMTFCDKQECQDEIPKVQQKSRDKRAAWEAREKKLRYERGQAEIAHAKSGYLWKGKESWEEDRYWTREEDKVVCWTLYHAYAEHMVDSANQVVSIPLDDFARIIAAMSKTGFTPESYKRALDALE